MTLVAYKKKRNFKNTPEPGAAKQKRSKALTFVVQRHDASHLHYDFRLEMEGVLKSWAVPKGPSMKAGERRLAVMVEDHPLSYGKFYGEIPEGNYGAGNVDVWDNGTYKPLKEFTGSEEKELLAELKKGDLKFVLNGKHLKGAYALVRMNDGQDKNWLLIKKKDEHAVKDYSIEKIKPLKSKLKSPKKTASKAKRITRKKSPKAKDSEEETAEGSIRIEKAWNTLNKPMLARLTDKVINNPSWIYEAKYDGYRAITKVADGRVEMISRNGNSFNRQYESLVKELEKISDEVILDGEVVIEDNHGVTSFQLLQNYITSKEGVLKYFVFDVTFLNGHILTGLSLEKRKELLDVFFKKYKFKNVINSDYEIGKGEQLFKKLSAKGYEGIIAKDNEGNYYPGRRSDGWLKIKTVMMQEAIICGFTSPQKSRKYFGSLILGMYDDGKLKYIGNCGTGFTEASLEELHAKFTKLATEKIPFDTKPKMFGQKGKPFWLKPELVCNVKFLEWTDENRLRNPVFMGLRIDKKPEEVMKETAGKSKSKNKNVKSTEKEKTLAIGGKKVKCTNLSKVYWPDDGITKGDLISYYQNISKYILPYLKNRPMSLNRHPNGIKGPSFYQKDMDTKQLPSWAKTVRVYSKSNKAYIDYLLCNDAATLVYMANLGCIEINPWHSVYNHPENPTYMMLDLDPGDISFKHVVDTALVIKEIADELGIPSYCKTSGATGLHVYFPLAGKYDDDDVKTFAELLASLTHDRLPSVTSIERTVSKRKDKIYVDFLQNRKGQTLASAYSVRPRPHATVSTPLLWKEVNHKLSPEDFTIFNIEKRIGKVGDLWKGVLGKGIALSQVLRKIEKL